LGRVGGRYWHHHEAMTIVHFIVRLIKVAVPSSMMLLLLTVAAFCIGWYFFGLIGHPAGPNVSSAAYLTYAIVAPLPCLGSSIWFVFRKRAQQTPAADAGNPRG
jgi:uncharacterized RDD family membrane protein YckC